MLDRKIFSDQVRADLDRKMVFLGGPRQVGKTTLALALRPRKQTTYLNWDIDEHRTRILGKELGTTRLLVLDELHKHRRWRNYLKGTFDAIKAGSHPKREILVTGSARLDYYRHGGDSLQGRYHYLRLMPFSYMELGCNKDALESLFRFSGFPEPLAAQSEVEARRWSREYRSRLVRDDLRDLESIQDVGTFELMLQRLPETLGSPLSINALREDLQVAHKTLSNWLRVTERLYYTFRVPPMASTRVRAVKKEQKLYFYDWSLVTDEGLRFENMVALHLLKHALWLQDTEGRDVELRYFRDTDKREVDFVFVENNKPTMFVEVKLREKEITSSLTYLCSKYPQVPAWQIHLRGDKDFQTPEGIRCAPATELLERLAA